MNSVELIENEVFGILDEISGIFSVKITEQVREFLTVTDGEDSLQIVLRGHLYVEYELERLLRHNIENPDSILTNRFMFMNKLNLATALGLLPESKKKAYKKLNDLRNKYAHKIRFEVSDKDLEDFISVMDREVKDDFVEKHKGVHVADTNLKLKHALSALWTDASRTVYFREIEKYKETMEFVRELSGVFDGNREEFLNFKKQKLLELKGRIEFITDEY
ncbi:TPA: DUF4145 domain-containing protein [Bacillus thuringiensis]|uniref:DUF4145 domain-containing protein n=1 Tax=Bacillus thuringiensis TaxID=1428 RepID=A0A9X6KML7_BACTU|nr:MULTISPECIES: DUF4145 domain-containing protein [Bacillus cereus group]AJA17996.1 hypothetical protein BT4G5_03555 [Bacillus thuringiensis serovar galleriae]ETE93447.1 hypothetical protein C621_0209280 [Bacillus thuringiensis serovar aizawai str. Leapi01]ETE95116.1 hypothetical protein C623_0223055 [Bacillus thuringiensis serovar aizawai str. Hu4-2]KAB1374807.1 DUF4145 domain-containing protein [Bacillus thuringiensis]KLA26547.1 hypothetical protein B4158_6055 [Bacillus cereus]